MSVTVLYRVSRGTGPRGACTVTQRCWESRGALPAHHARRPRPVPRQYANRSHDGGTRNLQGSSAPFHIPIAVPEGSASSEPITCRSSSSSKLHGAAALSELRFTQVWRPWAAAALFAAIASATSASFQPSTGPTLTKLTP